MPARANVAWIAVLVAGAACHQDLPVCPEREYVRFDSGGWDGQTPMLETFTVSDSDAGRLELTSANGWISAELPPSPRGDAVALPDVGTTVTATYVDADLQRFITVFDEGGQFLLDAGYPSSFRDATRLQFYGPVLSSGCCEDDDGYERTPAQVELVDDAGNELGATGEVFDLTVDSASYLGVVVNAQLLDCLGRADDCGGRLDQAYVVRVP